MDKEPEIQEAVETPVVATPEAEVPVVEAPVEEAQAEAPVETPKEEAVEEAPVVEETPVVFAPDDPDVNTKVSEVLDRYELPQEVQAVIDHYKSQAETPSSDFEAYAEYGEPDAVKALLDRQALLDSVVETDTGFRPTTDKFAQSLAPEKAQWLWFDLSQLPSQKYPGLNQFEEGIADAFAVEGDTVGSVLGRYKESMEALRTGSVIQTSVPDFIPANLAEAYWSLPPAEREAFDMFHPSTDRIEYDDNGRATNVDEPIRAAKLKMLGQIQKGIDGDKFMQQQEVQTKENRQQQFHDEVATTQTKFYDTIRQTFTDDILKTVTFSSDPRMQTMLAHQNVALLTQAFSQDSDGAYARQALADAGINFDTAKAGQLVRDIELASVALASAKQIQDGQGNPINQVELNKAKAHFERAGKAWQQFAKDILQQEAALTSTGTAKAVARAADDKVAKEKMQIKARPGTKGAPSSVTKKESLPAYGTPEWDGYWADRQMEREAARAKSYT